MNATQTPLVMCRECDSVAFCQPFTVAEFERTSHDEGQSDVNYTVTTGQCEACLKANGADEHCDVPEEDPRTAAEVNGETELELSREWSGK